MAKKVDTWSNTPIGKELGTPITPKVSDTHPPSISENRSVDVSDTRTLSKSDKRTGQTGRLPAGRYKRQDGVVLKKTTFFLEVDLVKQLKENAFESGETISEIAARALRAYLSRSR